jgi:heme-degrading monooxygenase HmoA
MRDRILSWALAFCLPLLAVTAAGETAGPDVVGTVNHVVIAWLKQPGDEAARKRFIETTKRFATLPGVIGHRVGPLLPSDSKVADNSFDVAVVVTFKDKEALAAYLEHPEHKKGVEEVLKPLLEKVVVYDFVAR